MFLVVTFWYIIPFIIFNTLDVVSIESFDLLHETLDTKIQTCESLSLKILYMRYMMIQARNILIPLTVSIVFQRLFTYKNNIYQVFVQMDDHQLSHLSDRNIDQIQVDARNETVDLLLKRIFVPNCKQPQRSLKLIIFKHFVPLFLVYYYVITSPTYTRSIDTVWLIDQIGNRSLAIITCLFLIVGILGYYVAIYYILNYILKLKHFYLLLRLFVSKLNRYQVKEIPLDGLSRVYESRIGYFIQKEMYCTMANNPPLILSVTCQLMKIAYNKYFAMLVNFNNPLEMHMINYCTNVIKHKWVPYLFWNWNGFIYQIYSKIELYAHHIESKYAVHYIKQSVQLLQNHRKMSRMQVLKFWVVFCVLGIVVEMIITRTIWYLLGGWEFFPDLYSLIFKMIPKIIPKLDFLILVTRPFFILIFHLTIATSYGMIIYGAIVLPNYYYISRWRVIQMIADYVEWSWWLPIQTLIYYHSGVYEFLTKPAFLFLITQFVNAIRHLCPCDKFDSIARMLWTTYYRFDVVVPRTHFTMILKEGICNHMLQWNQIKNLLVHSLLLEYFENNEFMCQIVFTVSHRFTFLFACLCF